ncbi:MAG: hypothetical protein KF784_10545 [Fimbriimonadaceae bacterium]|nr:hypothetical protein [Fimbriimonadaceae bacterium]
MKKLLCILGIAVVASSAMSQVWSQPWTRPLPAWTSVVRSCTNPKPYRLMALDDFMVNHHYVTLNTIVYWGTVTNFAQLGRPMFYAIYKDNGNCQPDLNSMVWRDCLRPDWEFVDGDCQNMRVFRFKQALTVGNLPFLTFGKYWLQISEDDSQSANPNVPEFAWSSHQPVNLCPAVQFDSTGAIIQPLIDPCNGQKDDLAFELY